MRSSLVSKVSVFSLFCPPIWPPWRYVKTSYSYVFVALALALALAIAIAKASYLFQNNEMAVMLVKVPLRLKVVFNRTTGRIVTDAEIIISALLLRAEERTIKL